jgi:predicted TIM-barrel fold metal-dependent hydrolase
LHSLDHAGALLDRTISAFGATIEDKPSEVFKRHVYVSPFPEEDVPRLIEVLGRERVLFGSDWPHPEGTRMPGDYTECLEGLDEAVVRRVMRENAMELLEVS